MRILISIFLLFCLFNSSYANTQSIHVSVNRIHKPTNIEIKGFAFINPNLKPEYTLEDDNVLNVGDIQSSINLLFNNNIVNITIVEFDENKKLKIEKEVLKFNESNLIDHYIDTEYNKYEIKIER